MNNTKLTGRYQLILLLIVMTLVFSYEQIISVTKLLILESWFNIKAVAEIESFSKGSPDEKAASFSAVSLEGRVIIAGEGQLTCYGHDGMLIWQRALSSNHVDLYKFGSNCLIVDKSRGDLALLSAKNEILYSKKDIGVVKNIEIFKDERIALSKSEGNAIAVFDSELKLVGTLEPPAGDVVMFKFSMEEPRLLVYSTALINGEFSSFIYHYSDEALLLSTSDLEDRIVYDFEHNLGLTTIGSDWIASIMPVQNTGNSSSMEKLSVKQQALDGFVECIGTNNQYLMLQTLIKEGADQGKSRISLYDWHHNLLGDVVTSDYVQNITMGKQFAVIETSGKLLIYNYELKNVAQLQMDEEGLGLEWIDAFQLLVMTNDAVKIYKVK